MSISIPIIHPVGGSRAEAVKAARAAYQHGADQLSERRTAAARELGERVSQALAGLGMPGGRFAIVLERIDKPTPGGLETVEFQVSANPGQPLRALAKVASGGELSRISLALTFSALGATLALSLIHL